MSQQAVQQPEVERPRLTQADWVILRLQQGPTCGTQFLKMHIPRYSAVIWELNRKGRNITARKCQKHVHASRQVEYVLEGD